VTKGPAVAVSFVKEGANPSGVTPVEYNIIVRPDPVEEKTKGGVIKPQTMTEQEEWASTKATVMAMSPMAFRKTANGDAWEGPAPVEGGRVMFARYAGKRFEGADGETYVVLKDEDVIGIIEAE